MPFPHVKDKYKYKSVVTAKDYHAYKKRMGRMTDTNIPNTAIICYDTKLSESVVSKYDGKHIAGFSDFYILKDGRKRIVFVKCSIGSPAAAIVMEELIAIGVTKILSVGLAGSLQKDLGVKSIIICDKAIRDEGTSYHYLKPSKYAHPSKSLISDIKKKMGEMRIEYIHGPTWTVDALYRETQEEIKRYQKDGVLTVDMEASTVFAVAEAYNIESAAIFTISDYLGNFKWEPKFHMTDEYLERIFHIAKEVLLDT